MPNVAASGHRCARAPARLHWLRRRITHHTNTISTANPPIRNHHAPPVVEGGGPGERGSGADYPDQLQHGRANAAEDPHQATGDPDPPHTGSRLPRRSARLDADAGVVGVGGRSVMRRTGPAVG